MSEAEINDMVNKIVDAILTFEITTEGGWNALIKSHGFTPTPLEGLIISQRVVGILNKMLEDLTHDEN